MHLNIMKKSYFWRLKMEWRLSFRDLGGLYDFALFFLIGIKTVLRIVLRNKAFPVFGLYPAVRLFQVGPKRGKRILIFSQDCSSGSGAFRSCVAMAELLRKKNDFDVIMVMAQGGDGENQLKTVGIPYVVVLSKWWLVDAKLNGRRSMRKMVSDFELNHVAVRNWLFLIRKLDVDLVHINSLISYVPAVAAHRAGVPVVWHLRDMLEEDHGFSIYNRSLGLQLAGESDRLIAVSECVRKKYASLLGEQKVIRIYNGVDLARFFKPRKNILSQAEATFVFLGNLEEKKGPIEFSMACAELYRRGVYGFRVWFVGGDRHNLKDELNRFFSNVGMLDRITYWGMQERPEDWLEKADVAFVCSRCEAFGRVTVEMMLSGCLVIGADTGGTTELIQDGKTGLLYHRVERCASDLPEKMAWALANREEARHLASAGREMMARTMTADRNADEVAALYREVLAL